ncbi:hypothetical protein yc1106_02046 [Curvularia clavata]|uniref:DUF7730 domain-containing protein n=1 Tax=Curvularia clavata TaxID=95742 RepID=A0A9Q8Z250_CURCL|nr:hypothetical protein yc1106_02046 [Curvularia clavata]
MASRNSTSSRSRASSNTSSSLDATMMEPSPSASRPARLRNPSQSALPTPTTSHTHSHNARSDPSFSLLLSLPRELRDRVYVFALVSELPFWWPGKSPESELSDCDNVGVGLLRANKQVYRECVDILYSQNKFVFTHPSDCNMFRVVASPASVNIANVYFRIRQKDLKLWATYLGSKQPERSLKSDLPNLKSLWVFLRCGAMGLPAAFNTFQAAPAGLLGGLGGQIQAVQNALGQQMHALQQQAQSLTQVMANTGAPVVGGGGTHAQPGGGQLPPPPPPAPPMPFLQFAQGALALGAHHQAHQPQHHPANTAPHAHGQQNQPLNANLLAQQYLQHAQMHQQPNGPPPPLMQNPQHLEPMGDPQARQTTGATSRQDAHALFTSFLRFERELGLESLCLLLRDTLYSQPSTSLNFESSSSSKSSSVAGSPPTLSSVKPRPEVKIVCIIHLPRRILERLVALHPDELSVDVTTQDARTQFRKLHGIEVSLELNGCPPIRSSEQDAADHDDAFAHDH